MLNGDSSSDILRSKNKKRDEQIRKKVEQELTRRKTTKTQLPTLSKRNTVSSLKPNQAVIILETCRIFEACQLMAAKRTDAVLAVCETGELSGILTDKDIVFRVVSEGLNVMTTRVKDVMTPKPMTVYDQGNRNEALNIMISRKFRHLPVIKNNDDDTTSVVGLLDITKCVFERLDDLERKVIEDQSIINAMEVLEKRGSVSGDRASSLKSEHGCPEISSILANKDKFPRVSVKASVREAAQVMKLHHSTAVLVMGTPDGSEKVGGIFTTKDTVLRVIAGSLEPSVTSVVRVMTPHPDFVSSKSTILEALKKLHQGHFLHLPVIDNTDPKGLVDVMTLTIAMLTYLISKNSIGAAEGLDEGPMWNTFWNSTFAASVPEADRVSQFSESRSTNHRGPVNDHQFSPSKDHQQDGGSLITPDLSASQYVPVVVPDEFSFKLRDMMVAKGKIYRFRSNTSNLKQFYEKVLARTKYTSEFPQKGDGSLDIFGPEITRLSYLDDEGDVVSIESDMDLKEAVSMACGMKAKQLVVYLGEPPSNVNSRSSTPVAWLEGEVLEKGGSALDFLVGLPLAVNVAISASIVVLSFYLIKQISK